MVSTVVVTAADGLAPMLVSFPTGEGVDVESREQAISRTATIQMMAKASLKVLSPMAYRLLSRQEALLNSAQTAAIVSLVPRTGNDAKLGN